jgi:hypothetical protein
LHIEFLKIHIIIQILSSFQKQTVSIWRAENNEEGNAIIFHHESETVENCCNNHFPYFEDNLDENLYDNDNFRCTTITSKVKQCNNIKAKLNNEVDWLQQPLTSLKITQRNIFPIISKGKNMFSLSSDLRVFQKNTNLTRNSVNLSQNLRSLSSSRSSLFLIGPNSADHSKLNKRNNDTNDIHINLDLVASHYNKPSSSNFTSQSRLHGNFNNSFGNDHLEPYVASTSVPLTIQIDGIGGNVSTANLNSLIATTPIHLQHMQDLGNNNGWNGLVKVMRSRVKKYTDFFRGDDHGKRK